MVIFISKKLRPLFEFEFKTLVVFICSATGSKAKCSCISIDSTGMFAFKEGGVGNCIFDENNHRHNRYSNCLFELEYDYIKQYLSEKQKSYIAKLHKQNKFQWAGERTYKDSFGNSWILHQNKTNLYRNERGQTRKLVEVMEYAPVYYYD